MDKEDEKELVSNGVGNNNDPVHLLQNNEGNNIEDKEDNNESGLEEGFQCLRLTGDDNKDSDESSSEVCVNNDDPVSSLQDNKQSILEDNNIEDEKDKKELVSNGVGNNNDPVPLLQDNEDNNIHPETTKKKKQVKFLDNFVEIIDIQSVVDKKKFSELKKAPKESTKKTSALDEFLSPENTHTGDTEHTNKILKNIMKLDLNTVNSYKHCWIKKIFSDRCKKEDAVYRAYYCYKHNAVINTDNKITNLEAVKQQMLECLDQWNTTC